MTAKPEQRTGGDDGRRTGSSSPRVQVLVVEDEPVIAGLVESYREREGFAVEVTPDGESAVALAWEHRPDVIVLDLMLPGMDGIEVCRRVRTFSRCRSARLCVLPADRVLAEAMLMCGLTPPGLTARGEESEVGEQQQGRAFTRDLRDEAVKFLIGTGRPFAQVARGGVGVNKGTTTRCKRRAGSNLGAKKARLVRRRGGKSAGAVGNGSVRADPVVPDRRNGAERPLLGPFRLPRMMPVSVSWNVEVGGGQRRLTGAVLR